MNQEIVDLYYNPLDFDIDDEPYPEWRRMREEAGVILFEDPPQHDLHRRLLSKANVNAG
jgi:hypothetical protein